MKRIVSVIALLSIFCIGITGCSKSEGSWIKNQELDESGQEIENAAGDFARVMEINYGSDIKGRALYMDEWKNGTRVNSELLQHGKAQKKEKYAMSATIPVNKEQLEWEITNDTMTMNPKTKNFPGSDSNFASLTTAIADDQKDTFKLKSGDEYILAVVAFQLTADSIKSITCGSAKECEEQLKEYEYAVVLRLKTTAEAKEAEELQ